MVEKVTRNSFEDRHSPESKRHTDRLEVVINIGEKYGDFGKENESDIRMAAIPEGFLQPPKISIYLTEEINVWKTRGVGVNKLPIGFPLFSIRWKDERPKLILSLYIYNKCLLTSEFFYTHYMGHIVNLVDIDEKGLEIQMEVV